MIENFYDEDVIFNESEKLWFFPVENSLGAKNEFYLKPSRVRLGNLLKDESLGSRMWNAQIQLSWMFFMHNGYEAGDHVLSLEDARKQAQAIGFTEKDVSDMLNFFGKAGTILNFSDRVPDDELSIVMRPDWLLEVLASFILCREEFKGRLTNMRRLKDGSRKLVPLLEREGIMSSTVLANLVT